MQPDLPPAPHHHPHTRKEQQRMGANTPHGGRLIDRYLDAAAADALRHSAQELPTVRLSARQQSDLNLLAQGGFSPLEGFMGQDDYDRVVTTMHLAGGLPWSIPVTLAVAADDAPRVGQRVALRAGDDTLLGAMEVREVYGYDKRREA